MENFMAVQNIHIVEEQGKNNLITNIYVNFKNNNQKF